MHVSGTLKSVRILLPPVYLVMWRQSRAEIVGSVREYAQGPAFGENGKSAKGRVCVLPEARRTLCAENVEFKLGIARVNAPGQTGRAAQEKGFVFLVTFRARHAVIAGRKRGSAQRHAVGVHTVNANRRPNARRAHRKAKAVGIAERKPELALKVVAGLLGPPVLTKGNAVQEI